MVKGRKASAAATAGTLRFTSGKKGIALKANLQGLDVSTLSGPVTVTVAVGPYSAAATATAQASGKKLRLH